LDAVQTCPALSSRAQATPGHGHIQVRVLKDDERIDSAQFQIHFLQQSARARTRSPPDFGRSGERNQIDLWDALPARCLFGLHR